MPSSLVQRLRTKVSTLLPWRLALPDREVSRTVQGVRLSLPWSHPLPDYARSCPAYGQNLVDLALALNAAGGPGTDPLLVLDVGANVGDSAVQILAKTRSRILCVEGDPYWIKYLRRNVDHILDVVVEEALLSTNRESDSGASPLRAGGTTTFVTGGDSSASARVMHVDELQNRNSDFSQLRLVKSDTDGWDCELVPAVIKAWRPANPVVFFEFDPILTRGVGNDSPNALWSELADLGYESAAVWDNGASPLGRLPIAEIAEAAASLEPRPVHLGYHFWDVAVCHRDDVNGLRALDSLMQIPYDVRGIRRS